MLSRIEKVLSDLSLRARRSVRQENNPGLQRIKLLQRSHKASKDNSTSFLGAVASNSSTEEHLRKQGVFPANEDSPFFTSDAVTGILIACLVLGTMLVAFLCLKCCKKCLAKRRMKNFQHRSKRKKEDEIELCLEDHDVLNDSFNRRQGKKKPNKVKRGFPVQHDTVVVDVSNHIPIWHAEGGNKQPSPPRSVTSCGPLLENMVYDDLITSVQGETMGRQNQHGSGEVLLANPMQKFRDTKSPSAEKQNSSAEYMNLGPRVIRNRRREHAYETIEVAANGVKIPGRLNPPPSPIQIKRQSKSEDLTIFPFTPMQPNDEDLGKKRAEPLSHQEKQTTKPLPNKPSITSRSSMCVVSRSHNVEPSPYLLRTWSAPDTATIEVRPRERETKAPTSEKARFRQKVLSPRLRLSKTKITARIADVMERKIEGQANIRNNSSTHHQRTGSKNIRLVSQRPRSMRRRIKRKVRKKRRVHDERRRQGIQLLRSRDDSGRLSDNITGGHNRWPLPGVYFDSSSGSSSDVMRIRAPFLRNDAHRDPSAREASLLEDIWCHLDEITQRTDKIKESYSSRRASDSLSSLSDDVIIHNSSDYPVSTLSPISTERFASHDSASDRGYCTYKKYLARSSGFKKIISNQRYRVPQQGKHNVVSVTSSGLSTLTDNGTGAWVSSSATRYSSISSSRNNSLFGLKPMALSNFNFGKRTFSIPRITITGPNDFIPQKEEACPVIVAVQKDYLEVLNLYLGSKCGDPIYEELVDCVTASSGGCDMMDNESCSSVIYSHIKRENAKYAVINKGACLQEATLIDAVVCEPVYGTLRVNHEIKPAGDIYDAEGTSNAIHNECVDEIVPHFDATMPKAKHVVVERSSKNYVVVAPKLFCKRVASCGQGFSDVTSSLADVSTSKTRSVSSECLQIQEDSASFSVFMEMNV